MQAVGIVLIVAGLAAVLYAASRGSRPRAHADAPRPPREPRFIMAAGIVALLAGVVLTIATNV